MSILEKSTQTLLFKPIAFKEIYDDLHELADFYALHSGVTIGNITDKDIMLPSGKAISPIKAAFCLVEIQRTAVFIQGINKAIAQLQATFPGERIHILYAGCGPYATLVTPFTSRYTANELAFHLLDINEISLTAAKKLYKGLELENYVAEWICADATTYRLPEDQTIHMVISETMLNALRKEPQVDIMLNLIPQMHEKALFIPQNITVTAQLLDNRKEMDRGIEPYLTPERMNLGCLYTIGRQEHGPPQQVLIEIPQEIQNHKNLSLLTDITVYDNERLSTYDSSLNMPVRIQEVSGHEGGKLIFNYERGEKPGFKFEWA
jgi:predicted RNA methylase